MLPGAAACWRDNGLVLFSLFLSSSSFCLLIAGDQARVDWGDVPVLGQLSEVLKVPGDHLRERKLVKFNQFITIYCYLEGCVDSVDIVDLEVFSDTGSSRWRRRVWRRPDWGSPERMVKTGSLGKTWSRGHTLPAACPCRRKGIEERDKDRYTHRLGLKHPVVILQQCFSCFLWLFSDNSQMTIPGTLVGRILVTLWKLNLSPILLNHQ